MARMPGARPQTADTAIGKAMVSAMTGRPSAAMAGRGNTPLYQELNDNTGGKLRFFQGALPIVRRRLHGGRSWLKRRVVAGG